MRPNVPNPTAKKKNKAQTDVTTRPTGKKASEVPGITNGAAEMTAAEADAAAWGSALVGPLAAFAKTPLTKDASLEERVVVTSWFDTGLRAARSICGMRRG